MSFETAADAFIRPTIGPAATPAHGAAAGAAAGASGASAQQIAWLSEGASGERGAKAEHQTVSDELSFYDLLDVINPLQHIPGVASVYRALTGDEIKAPAEILGGALYGGPIGLVASAANVIVKESSGRDLTQTALAMLFGEEAVPGNVADAAAEDLGGPAAEAVPEAALAASLAAETEPAAGPATAAYTPTAGLLPPEAAPASTTPDPATMATDDAGEGAAAVAQALEPTEGPTLSGKAALNAFLSDLATLGRNAAGVPQTGAEEVAEASPTAKDTAAAQTATQAQAVNRQGNLVGLGNRDQRPSARPSASRAPAVVIPAAQLLGTAQPAAATATGQPAPRIVSGAAPRLPGSAPVDPTLFIPKETGAAVPASDGAAPNDFSAQMMRALQKYETMIEDRPAAAGDPG